MHPTISYELAQARIADLRRQAEREGLARAAQLPSSATQPSRKRFLSLRSWPGSQRHPGDELPVAD